MQAPNSVLNQKISRNRRFATQQFKVERLKRVAKASHGTLNDVVLALCAGALRRFLQEQDGLPTEPLTHVTRQSVSYTHLTLPTSDLV